MGVGIKIGGMRNTRKDGRSGKIEGGGLGSQIQSSVTGMHQDSHMYAFDEHETPVSTRTT